MDLPNNMPKEEDKKTNTAVKKESLEEIEERLRLPEEANALVKNKKDFSYAYFIGIIIFITLIVIISFFYNNPDFLNSFKKNDSLKNISTLANSSLLANISNNASNQSLNCSENWTCTNYSSCNMGIRSRNCTDSNNCKTNKSNPILKENCCNWSCVDWSECYPANFSYRKCIIDKDCKDDEKPLTKQACNYTAKCKDSPYKENLTKSGFIIDKNDVPWEDYCDGDFYIVKVSCDQYDNVKTTKFPCDNQCKDGACFKNITL